MINFDGNSHHILHLSFDHYESKSNVSRILETRMIVFRDQNYPGQHGPIPYVLQPAVKCSRCLYYTAMIPLPPFYPLLLPRFIPEILSIR